MIYLLIFIFEVSLLCLIEKKLWGIIITPVNVLSIPYAIVTLIAVLYSNCVTEVPNFYLPSLVIPCLGLFLFFIPSLFFSTLVKKDRINRYVTLKRDDSYNLLKILGIIGIIISLLRIRNTISDGFSFGGDEFSEQYEVSGFFAHLNVLLSAIFSYMIYKSDSKHKSAYVIIGLLLIGMYAVGVKSWIIAPVLIGYLARLFSNKSILNLKNLLFPVFICSGVFFLSYYLIMILSEGNDITDSWMNFVVNHFMDYLIGGSLSFSLDYQQGILEPEMKLALVRPIINFFIALFGDGRYIDGINPVFLSIGELGDTNVRTFIGTIWCYSHDSLFFIVFVLNFAFIVYFLYYVSVKSQNVFLLLANCSVLTFLALGFFEFYWLNLSPYEIPVLFIMFSYITRFKVSYAYK